MSGRRGLLVVIVAVLAIVVVIAAIALSLDYDSPELGRALLGRLGERGDLDVRARGFRLNVLRGLKLEDVEVTSRAPGTRFHATAERLVLAHRLGPLLRGEVLVEEIVLERPAVELLSGAEAGAAPRGGPAPSAPEPEEPPAASEEAASSGLTLSIERFAIVDGSLAIRSADAAGEVTEIRGLDLELRGITLDPGAPSLLQGLRAAGELAADEVVTATVQARGARGEIRVADGHLRIADFQFPTVQGRLVVGELDVDFNADPYTYELTVEGDPLDTNLIVGAGADGGLGPGRLDLEVAGDGSEEGNLAGQGVLSFAAGKLPGLPVLAGIERLFAGTAIVGESYEPFDVRFRIRGDRLDLEPFAIRTGELELAVSGSLHLDGPLALTAAFSAPREGFQALEVPEEVIEALTDSEGRVNLPIAVSGPAEDPKVAFDRSGWQRMARKRVESELKKELGKKLGKLFGKKENGS